MWLTVLCCLAIGVGGDAIWPLDPQVPPAVNTFVAISLNAFRAETWPSVQALGKRWYSESGAFHQARFVLCKLAARIPMERPPAPWQKIGNCGNWTGLLKDRVTTPAHVQAVPRAERWYVTPSWMPEPGHGRSAPSELRGAPPNVVAQLMPRLSPLGADEVVHRYYLLVARSLSPVVFLHGLGHVMSAEAPTAAGLSRLVPTGNTSSLVRPQTHAALRDEVRRRLAHVSLPPSFFALLSVDVASDRVLGFTEDLVPTLVWDSAIVIMEGLQRAELSRSPLVSEWCPSARHPHWLPLLNDLCATDALDQVNRPTLQTGGPSLASSVPADDHSPPRETVRAP